MAERLPPLNALRCFDVAAKHLSFTKAAAELNVTHSAVSHQIKALETWLGAPLFRRVNRGLVLTNAGQAYLKPVRDSFERLAEATRRLRVRERTGPLTVSIMPSFAAKWLMPRLRRVPGPVLFLRSTASWGAWRIRSSPGRPGTGTGCI